MGKGGSTVLAERSRLRLWWTADGAGLWEGEVLWYHKVGRSEHGWMGECVDGWE